MSADLTRSPKNPRLRRLSGDEIELWRQVTTSVLRRSGSHLPEAAVLPDLQTPLKPAAHSKKPIPGPTAESYTPPISTPALAIPPLAALERRMKQRLLRGRTPVDGVLDLHGLYQDQAHHRLLNFLANAQADGARLVLVITGKGRTGVPEHDFTSQAGILRRQVPHWLRAPDMRGLVIGFEEAGQPHGGAGALYIRIRRHERGR